jgi:excisionase family DNA binding protein
MSEGVMSLVEQVYTVNEAADILRVHPRTIHRMIKAGELDAFTIRGYEYRIKKSVLDAYMSRKPKQENRDA